MEVHGRREASARIVEEDQLPYRDTSSISIERMTGPRRVRKRTKVEASEPQAWESTRSKERALWQDEAGEHAEGGGDEAGGQLLADMRFKLRFAQDGTAARSHGDRDTVECGRRVAEKGQASTPRRRGSGTVSVFGVYQCWCVCGQSLPRVISERGRGTLDYVVDLEWEAAGENGGRGERGHVSAKFGEYEFSTGRGFL